MLWTILMVLLILWLLGLIGGIGGSLIHLLLVVALVVLILQLITGRRAAFCIGRAQFRLGRDGAIQVSEKRGKQCDTKTKSKAKENKLPHGKSWPAGNQWFGT